jgi:hypothetical protein
MPRSLLEMRSPISRGRDALVFVLLTCYDTLEFRIEYTYFSGMKMSCYPFRASCALLIGPGYVAFEVVVHCYSGKLLVNRST